MQYNKKFAFTHEEENGFRIEFFETMQSKELKGAAVLVHRADAQVKTREQAQVLVEAWVQGGGA